MGGIKRNLGRVDGVLLLDKPRGITSQTAVTKARLLLSALKAGHTGTLDPMASGLLPTCFGEATKFSQLLLDGDKGYAATIKLGMKTTTGDLEGELTARSAVACSESDIKATLQNFRGAGMQMPPMYSALKHAGQPLYKYARAGREIARDARPIRITTLDFVDFIDDELRVNVSCSKGTYIRVLAEDIGDALGCGACLSALRRTTVGNLRLDRNAITLEALAAMGPEERKSRLLPVDSLVAMLPRIDLDRQQARLIAHGQAVAGHCGQPEGLSRIYGPDQDFLGIAETRAPGHLVAKRLLAQPGGDRPATGIAGRD